MGNRRQAREKALHYLYQMDSGVRSQTLDPKRFVKYFKVDERLQEYFFEIIGGVIKFQKEIDEELTSVAENWKLGRMARVDRCLLRVAIWELTHRHDIPTKVVVDEAIELAKMYGDKNSGAFINGILDRIAKEKRENIAS